MAVEYGTIGIRLMGEWKPDQQYDLLNQVSYDGSSYLVHTKPPVGTLPTNLDYWQVSSLGTSKATANSVGTVKPDGTTTEVSTDGSLSVKTAAQNALGLVKGSDGIKVGTDGSIDVNTIFTQATELANIIAEEAISSVLGKISKAIAVTIGLNENALLKNMLTNMDANDQNKIPTAAFVHKLYERIGMSEDLEIGTSLTNAVKLLNSNLNNVSNSLAVVTGSATKWAADITLNNCKKVGKLCFCSVYAYKASGTITAEEALFSLPWVPTSAAYFTVVGRNTATGATEPITTYIETEYGTIRATSAHSGSNEVRCYFAYITT